MLTLDTMLKAIRQTAVYGELAPERRGPTRSGGPSIALSTAEPAPDGWVRRWDGVAGAYAYVKSASLAIGGGKRRPGA